MAEKCKKMQQLYFSMVWPTTHTACNLPQVELFESTLQTKSIWKRHLGWKTLETGTFWKKYCHNNHMIFQANFSSYTILKWWLNILFSNFFTVDYINMLNSLWFLGHVFLYSPLSSTFRFRPELMHLYRHVRILHLKKSGWLFQALISYTSMCRPWLCPFNIKVNVQLFCFPNWRKIINATPP